MLELHIGSPYLEYIGNKIRLCANVTEQGKSNVLYYEVDREYEEYLCTERSDAFLIALLQHAMNNELNISWETPVTERIVYQLRTIYIPIISKRFPKIFKNIDLVGEKTDKDLEKKIWAVGTGVSGGVDSFYSILSNIDNTEISQNITHLLYASISNHTADEAKLRYEFDINSASMKRISDDLKLPLINVFSNESEFFFKNANNWNALSVGGFVYALQKLFSIYYYSSAYPYEEIQFGDGTENFDSSHFDLFTLNSISTRSINFIGSGGEVTRSEKVKCIKDNWIVKNNLYVCSYEIKHNCSKCDKCMRTMMTLYAYGCLNDYKTIFDLDTFYNYKNKYLFKMQFRRSMFDNEILKLFNDYNLKIKSKFIALLIRPIYLIWQKMKNNKIIMKYFYKFNLDYRLYGKEMAESIRYSKGIEREKNILN